MQLKKEVTVEGLFKYNQRCSMCGDIKAVRRDVYKKRIERYGTEKQLLKTYKCRKCRKEEKRKKKRQRRK